MKFQLEFNETFAHPADQVWKALTDRAALSRWLMDNDLDLRKSREFRLWCDDGKGHIDRYHCAVLVIEPPRRMVWSWRLEGDEGAAAMRIEFELSPVPEGTRLTLRHSGDRDPRTIEAFKGGWPEKLRQLNAALLAHPPSK